MPGREHGVVIGESRGPVLWGGALVNSQFSQDSFVEAGFAKAPVQPGSSLRSRGTRSYVERAFGPENESKGGRAIVS